MLNDWLFFVVDKKLCRAIIIGRFATNLYLLLICEFYGRKEIGSNDNRASMDLLVMSNEDKNQKKVQKRGLSFLTTWAKNILSRVIKFNWLNFSIVAICKLFRMFKLKVVIASSLV